MPETKDGTRLLTEDEAYAIAANEVKRELATAQGTIDGLRASLEAKSNEVDTLKVRETALETDLASVREEFDKFKSDIEEQRVRDERKTSRLASLREVASSMPDEFFSDQARMERVAAMSDEDFASYLSDIGSVAKAKSSTSGAPRESAMQNDQVPTKDKPVGSALKNFFEATVGV